MKPQCDERLRCRQNQLDFCQVRRFAQDINITLHELAITALLRTVRPEDIAHLQCLKGRRQLIRMVRKKTDQRNG